MLVLSRQRDETIMIGDDVEITVVDIRGDKVRLGITAPRHIQVHRKEVYDAIKRENQQAAKLSPRDVSDVIERNGETNKPDSTSRENGTGKPAAQAGNDAGTGTAKDPRDPQNQTDLNRPDQADRPQ